MSGEENKKPTTLDDVVSALQRNQEILEDIATWVKIGNVENVKKILSSTLDTPEKRSVYNLSDGKATREIGTLCDLDSKTISNYWRAWNKLGLMKTQKAMGGNYRYIKAFELKDYGIEVPPITPKKETQSKVLITEQQTSNEQAIVPGENE